MNGLDGDACTERRASEEACGDGGGRGAGELLADEGALTERRASEEACDEGGGRETNEFLADEDACIEWRASEEARTRPLPTSFG